MGIGGDVSIERELKIRFPKCKFFGTDPIPDRNRALFAQIGTFFNAAIGGAVQQTTRLPITYRLSHQLLYPDTGTYSGEHRLAYAVDLTQPTVDANKETVKVVDLPAFLVSAKYTRSTPIDLLTIDYEGKFLQLNRIKSRDQFGFDSN